MNELSRARRLVGHGSGLTAAGCAAAARAVRAAGLLSGLVFSALPAAAQHTGADAAYASAMAAHTGGESARAWALLTVLADGGHRQAAQQLLRMRQQGPGTLPEAGPGRLARWQTVASGAPLDPVPAPGPHGC